MGCKEWFDIPDEDFLQANIYGDIRSKDRVIKYTTKNGTEIKRFFKGQILNPAKNSCGYYIISGPRNMYKKKQKYVHILVAKTFPEICGEYYEGCIVDHLDTVRTNNNAFNLKCGSWSDNNSNPITMSKRKRNEKGRFA